MMHYINTMLSNLFCIGMCYRTKRECQTDVTIYQIALQLQTTHVMIDRITLHHYILYHSEDIVNELNS
jgi:hypothetical protein